MDVSLTSILSASIFNDRELALVWCETLSAPRQAFLISSICKGAALFTASQAWERCSLETKHWSQITRRHWRQNRVSGWSSCFEHSGSIRRGPWTPRPIGINAEEQPCAELQDEHKLNAHESHRWVAYEIKKCGPQHTSDEFLLQNAILNKLIS